MENIHENDELKEFRHWVKVQLVYRDSSQRRLAKELGIPHARISEALHGKPSGDKYLIPIIQFLGGDTKDFSSILKH